MIADDNDFMFRRERDYPKDIQTGVVKLGVALFAEHGAFQSIIRLPIRHCQLGCRKISAGCGSKEDHEKKRKRKADELAFRSINGFYRCRPKPKSSCGLVMWGLFLIFWGFMKALIGIPIKIIVGLFDFFVGGLTEFAEVARVDPIKSYPKPEGRGNF